MKLRAKVLACVAAVGLAGCSGPRPPINPPQLVSSNETDMAIQLFVQATIMMAKYHNFETRSYAEISDRSLKAGFNSLPFMPPIAASATGPMRWEDKTENLSPVAFRKKIDAVPPSTDGVATAAATAGYKSLVKYYIKTGWKASQLVCRNYLLGMEERNRYLQFLKEELGVGFGVADTVLAMAESNGTLTRAFSAAQTSMNLGISAYEKYRYSIDPEAARVLVETAQNKYAFHYMKLVDDPNLQSDDPKYDAKMPFTFSEAISAVSTIEYQCTRSGVAHLLNRAINNTPTNLKIDDFSGTVFFESSKAADDGSSSPAAAKKTARRAVEQSIAAARNAARQAKIAAAAAAKEAAAAAEKSLPRSGTASAPKAEKEDSLERKKPRATTTGQRNETE